MDDTSLDRPGTAYTRIHRRAIGRRRLAVRDYRAPSSSDIRGIALREVPLKSGRCNYPRLVDRKPVGVVEAKKEGATLSGVAEQSSYYAANLPGFLADGLRMGDFGLRHSSF